MLKLNRHITISLAASYTAEIISYIPPQMAAIQFPLFHNQFLFCCCWWCCFCCKLSSINMIIFMVRSMHPIFNSTSKSFMRVICLAMHLTRHFVYIFTSTIGNIFCSQKTDRKLKIIYGTRVIEGSSDAHACYFNFITFNISREQIETE